MMTTTGRAALFHGVGQPLELAWFPVPEPVGSEVLVRVTCCTLCASDLHTHAGRREAPTPAVLGHEIVGRIEAINPGSRLTVGDRVTWSIAASCGACFFCGDGLPQKCERLRKYGHERSTPDRPFTGGLADHVLLEPGTFILRVPDEIPDVVAAPANCATATAAALLRAGGFTAGRTVAILGAGVLGVTAAALARASGAREVIVCDPNADRRARAGEFGATRTGEEADPGADLVLECAGTAESVAAALALPRVGGTVVLAGTVRPTPPVPLDPERVVRRLLTIRGVHNYAPVDLETAVAFLAGPGRAFPFAGLVGRSFSLEAIEEAFAHAHAHPGSRVAVVP